MASYAITQCVVSGVKVCALAACSLHTWSVCLTVHYGQDEMTIWIWYFALKMQLPPALQSLFCFHFLWYVMLEKKKSCQNGFLLKHGYMYVDYRLICNYVCEHIDNPPMLYITHVLNYSRFSVLQMTESWVGPRNKVMPVRCVHITSFPATAQLSTACSTEKWERFWNNLSRVT